MKIGTPQFALTNATIRDSTLSGRTSVDGFLTLNGSQVLTEETYRQLTLSPITAGFKGISGPGTTFTGQPGDYWIAGHETQVDGLKVPQGAFVYLDHLVTTRYMTPDLPRLTQSNWFQVMTKARKGDVYTVSSDWYASDIALNLKTGDTVAVHQDMHGYLNALHYSVTSSSGKVVYEKGVVYAR